MNTSDGENVEQLGATTAALAKGSEQVQDDAEKGPVDTDADGNVDGQDNLAGSAGEVAVDKTTTTVIESHVEGSRNEDLPTEVQGAENSSSDD